MIQCDTNSWDNGRDATARKRPNLTSLVLASPADLGLETGLDSVDRTPRPARLASHEEYTVLLSENGVWRFARLARHVLD